MQQGPSSMPLEATNYLLIDIDNEFSRAFAEYYVNEWQNKSEYAYCCRQ